MEKVLVKPYDVIENSSLPELSVDHMPSHGDPLEIDGELYFVCELDGNTVEDHPTIGVIPLVVRNPARVRDINKYLACLSVAHRRVKFINEEGFCDLNSCSEMVIT